MTPKTAKEQASKRFADDLLRLMQVVQGIPTKADIPGDKPAVTEEALRNKRKQLQKAWREKID